MVAIGSVDIDIVGKELGVAGGCWEASGVEDVGLLGGDPAGCPSCNGGGWGGEIEGGDNVKEGAGHERSEG